MLCWPGKLRELAKLRFRHDIFFLKIPTSGTHFARRMVVVCPQSRLSQKIFFSSDCNSDSHKEIFAMWHASLDTQGPPAAILKLRASPPAPLSSIVEHFLYMNYVTASTRGA
jgi:hypothetical protein